MKRLTNRIIPLLLIFVLSRPTESKAYDIRTHEALNQRAVLASQLDTRLREALNFSNGVQEVFVEKSVIDWIGTGGILEDEPVRRTRNHFHYPLRSPWQSAGLDDFPFTGISSIIWGQNSSQGFSWINARRAYKTALTASSRAERDQGFADMFRGLGQVMHLIADSSVPAHVRNDQHALPIPGDPYEDWVEDQADPQTGETPEQAQQRFLSAFVPTPTFPDLSILNLPIGGQDATDAPVPIARLWDTDRYDGTDLPITLFSQIGITEYTNANFFSKDTVFANQLPATQTHFSPFPSSADVEEVVDRSTNRKYWRTIGATLEEPQHLAVVSKRTFWQKTFGVGQGIRGGLDDRVHEVYARLLLPRAVGYSAALLDYFFRGTFDFSVNFQPQSDQDLFGTIITNTAREKMEGTVTAYIDDTNGARSPADSASFELSLDPGAHSAPLFFPLSPPTSERSLVLVFQGRLGNEEVAIAAKIKRVGGPHWVATGSGGNSTYRIPGIEPITVTMKFKNVSIGRIEASAVDQDGGPATDLVTGAGTGSLEVTGSVPDFTTFTVTLKPPIPRRPVATQLSVGATLNPGGFICISEISGIARPSQVNAGNSGFGPATCPE